MQSTERLCWAKKKRRGGGTQKCSLLILKEMTLCLNLIPCV